MAGYDFGLNREFILRVLQRLHRGCSIQAAHLEHDSTRLNHSHIILDVPFTRTHAGFWWFMREWFGRENSNPYLAAAFHFTDNRPARSFDLTRSYPAGFQRLQTKLTETH